MTYCVCAGSWPRKRTKHRTKNFAKPSSHLPLLTMFTEKKKERTVRKPSKQGQESTPINWRQPTDDVGSGVRLLVFSIIAQVIIEMRALWLVENYAISCYNHPARGDYNAEALIFKMATARFLDVSEKETNKRKENTLSLIITWIIVLKQSFPSGSMNILEYFVSGNIPQYSLHLGRVIVKFDFFSVLHVLQKKNSRNFTKFS